MLREEVLLANGMTGLSYGVARPTDHAGAGRARLLPDVAAKL
jgi:hypothetical protein